MRALNKKKGQIGKRKLPVDRSLVRRPRAGKERGMLMQGRLCT